jgi:hypothetical protein|tara:strand:- start:92 stop:385 length:294 start_codon:yes stop_codon:yes gene_type:complete
VDYLKKGKRMEMKNKKWCCYLLGLLDLICFVGGAYLLSIAIFGGCCGAATSCNCGVLGLPLIALGLVIHCWKKCCCCGYGKESKCCSSKIEPQKPNE